LREGQCIHLFGVSWFGFETEDHVVHGLWSRGYKEMIEQMKRLGFNAVRIPFCPATLAGVDITSYINFTKNPDLEGLNSLAVLDKVLAELDSRHMYILLDHHRPDCQAISELWYTEGYTEKMWISDLTLVAERYVHLPYFMGLDIKNEPHGAATWGTSVPATDWNRAAERAAEALSAVNGNILIFVEGVGENPVCSSSVSHWWGGNFEPEKCTPLGINPKKRVFSPHVYGPDVYGQPYFEGEDFPGNMPEIWDTHFGYLADQQKVVAVGEFGGKYGHGGDPEDVTWQNAIVDYFISKGICDFFYWSWNPNSSDTGGILQDDWNSFWQDKVDNLNRLMNACSCAGTVIYVNRNDGTCGGKGPCYTTLQDAVRAAGATAEIRVAQGTYSDPVALAQTKTVTLEGGWDAAFGTQTPQTTFIKAPTVTQGSLTLRMVTVKP
jgi:endoglucanase